MVDETMPVAFVLHRAPQVFNLHGFELGQLLISDARAFGREDIQQRRVGVFVGAQFFGHTHLTAHGGQQQPTATGRDECDGRIFDGAKHIRSLLAKGQWR